MSSKKEKINSKKTKKIFKSLGLSAEEAEMYSKSYSDVLSQLSQIKSLISDLKIKMTKENGESEEIKEKSIKIEKFEECQDWLEKMKDELPQNINKYLKSLQAGVEQISKLSEFNKFIDGLKNQVSKELNSEFDRFKKLFDSIKLKISSVFEKQLRMSSLKSFVEKIVSNVSNFIRYNPDDLNKRILENLVRKGFSDTPKKIEGNCFFKRGGNGNNSSEYFASLGIPTKLISVIGRGSEWMIDELKDNLNNYIPEMLDDFNSFSKDLIIQMEKNLFDSNI